MMTRVINFWKLGAKQLGHQQKSKLILGGKLIGAAQGKPILKKK